jgi:hypothetical protein
MSLPLIELLYAALNARWGVVVSTSDPTRLRQQLYAERRKSSDFDELSFLASPFNPSGELFIMKKSETDDGS